MFKLIDTLGIIDLNFIKNLSPNLEVFVSKLDWQDHLNERNIFLLWGFTVHSNEYICQSSNILIINKNL